MDLPVPGAEAAYPDAAFGISLGHGIEEDHIVIYALKVHRGHVWPSGVDELPVDLVAEQEKVMPADYVSELLHLLAGVEIARGVVGIADEYGLGPGGDLLLELLDRRQAEAVLDAGLDAAYHGADRNRESHVVGIEGVGDYDLVARAETGQEREEHGLGAAGGDDYLLRRQVYAVFRVIADHLGAQGEAAVGGAVFEYLPVDMPEGVEAAAGRPDVGLADVEMIDLDSVALRLVSVGRKLAYG